MKKPIATAVAAAAASAPSNGRAQPATPYSRPPLGTQRPDRRPGGFYRTAHEKDSALGGVPLRNVEDTVVAAVRLGYKVASAQVDRSARWAQRLRAASDKAAGPDSDAQGLDAAERLIFKSMMTGLSWLESAAADADSPIKRFAMAEYRLLGSMLGLVDPRPGPGAAGAGAGDGKANEAASSPAAATQRSAQDTTAALRIQHKGAEQRPVRLARWETSSPIEPGEHSLRFYSSAEAAAKAIGGFLRHRGCGDTTLELEINGPVAGGTWCAALCIGGFQVGIVEIVF